MTSHLSLSTLIGRVRDILNDPAAGVRAIYSSFHGFGTQGLIMLMISFGTFP